MEPSRTTAADEVSRYNPSVVGKAGPEGYIAENIPVYGYSGINTGIRGIWGFWGSKINFQGLGGGHTYPNAMQMVSFDRQFYCACTG
jgi:hypothetical protein